MIAQYYTATIHKQEFIVSRTKIGLQLYDLLTKTQQLLTATPSIVIVNTFKKESIEPEGVK
jgi:hypothetical protein